MRLFDNPVEKGKSFSDLRKYVNDFEVVEVKDDKGRIRKQAVYKGVWTVIRSPEPAVKLKLWGTLVLAIGLAAVYMRMMLLTHLTSGQVIVMLPFLVGLFPALYMLMGAFSLPFRGKPMRRDQYMHSFIRVSRSSAAIVVCVAVGLIAMLVFRIVSGNWDFFAEDRLFTVLAFLNAGLAAGAMTLLRSVDLTERPNEAYNPQML